MPSTNTSSLGETPNENGPPAIGSPRPLNSWHATLTGSLSPAAFVLSVVSIETGNNGSNGGGSS